MTITAGPILTRRARTISHRGIVGNVRGPDTTASSIYPADAGSAARSASRFLRFPAGTGVVATTLGRGIIIITVAASAGLLIPILSGFTTTLGWFAGGTGIRSFTTASSIVPADAGSTTRFTSCFLRFPDRNDTDACLV